MAHSPRPIPWPRIFVRVIYTAVLVYDVSNKESCHSRSPFTWSHRFRYLLGQQPTTEQIKNRWRDDYQAIRHTMIALQLWAQTDGREKPRATNVCAHHHLLHVYGLQNYIVVTIPHSQVYKCEPHAGIQATAKTKLMIHCSRMERARVWVRLLFSFFPATK